VLIASLGVLRRKEWARRAFVAVLGIDIVAVIVGLFVGQSIGMGLATQLASSSPTGEVPPGMGSGLALAGLLVVGVVAILLWLLFTFRSARVREEFASTHYHAPS
jgi:Na+-transporting NADH:ubiquinone oxidoreductase subunit NqrD